MAAELHAAGFVARVDHRKLPEKRAALLVAVVPVALGHHRGSGPMPTNGVEVLLDLNLTKAPT